MTIRNVVRRSLRGLDLVLDGLALFGLVVMILIISWQVFARFVLDDSPRWASESALVLMGWLGFLGAAILREGSHIAVGDLAGKRLGVPTHELLGGRSRREILVYGHANGETVEDTVEAVARYLDMGYRAIRAQCGVPGLAKAYGVGRGDLHYEPAETGLPPEHEWSTERYLDVVPTLFRRLREEFGFDVHLLHDAHHRLTHGGGVAGPASRGVPAVLARGPGPAENQGLYLQLRAHTTTPIAVGEVFNSVHDVEMLVTERLVDYIRTSVVHAGGITGLARAPR